MRYGWVPAGKAPDYLAGRTSVAPLPTDIIGRSLLVRLTGDLVVTGGTGAGAVRADAVAKLIDAVEIKAGNQTLQSWFGSALMVAERYFEPAQTPQVLPADDTAGTTAIDVQLRIPCYEPRSLTGDEKALALAVLPTPKLSITWGQPGDIFTDGTDNTGVELQNASVEVSVQTLEDMVARGRSFALPLVYSYEVDVTQSAQGKAVVLDNILAGTEVRAIIIQAEATGADAGGYEGSDALLSLVRFKINSREEINAARSVLQGDDVRTYGLDAATAGVVVLDAAKDERTERGASQLWTLAGREKPSVLLDLTKQAGDNRVRLTVIARRWAQ